MQFEEKRDSQMTYVWMLLVIIVVVLVLDRGFRLLFPKGTTDYDMDHLNEVKITRAFGDEKQVYYVQYTTPNPDVEVTTEKGSTTVTIAPYKCHTFEAQPNRLEEVVRMVLEQKEWK